MPSRFRFVRSSVGMKALVAVTGLALLLYVIVHLAGNLLVFFGPQIFNNYSHTLLSNPLLVPVEIGLLFIGVVHVAYAVRLYVTNRQARPTLYQQKRYAVRPPSRKNVASATMIVSGLWVLAFVAIHIKAFKYGTEYLVPGTGVRDLYRLEGEIFSNLWTVSFYVISMVVLGSHLWHGIVSAFQSLGAPWAGGARLPLLVGKTVAGLIVGGFMAIAVWRYVTRW